MNQTSGDVRRAYASDGESQIHYRHAGPEGTRSPLLLLHPTGASSYLYEPFIAEMGRDRTVIAPDLPGHGYSDRPTSALQIVDYAAAILALEAKLGLGVFDIMGYHGGGLIAAEMAVQQPSVVRKIVMVSGLAFNPSERDAMRISFTSASIADRINAFAQHWPVFRQGYLRDGGDEIRAWNLYLEAQFNPDIAMWGHLATVNYDLEAVLPKLSQPILILNAHEELDAVSRHAATLIKNGRLHDLPQRGHGFLETQSVEVGGIVRAFLDT